MTNCRNSENLMNDNGKMTKSATFSRNQATETGH